jgi:hypothetical protein
LKSPHCRVISPPKEHPSQQMSNDVHEITIVAEHVKEAASQMLETTKVMDRVLRKALDIVEEYTKAQQDIIAKEEINNLPN